MPKKIFIVGGDGFARECYMNLCTVMKQDASIEFSGFLGHGGYGHTVDYKEFQKLYLGEEREHQFAEDEYVIIGAGYPELRRKIYNDLKSRGVKFFTLHCGEDFNNTINVGEANIFIPPFAHSCDIKIGNGNVFNGDVLMGHDVEIGDFNFFGPRSQVLGSVTIGSDNVIGANSILLPHCRIGSHNKISPLSAVYKGCRDNCYLLGNPAVKIGTVEDKN